MFAERPYAPACDKNKVPILEILSRLFVRSGLVLEIGSGTGQHAVYFAGQLAHLVWQPTDQSQNLPGIQAWCKFSGLANVKKPIEVDVNDAKWPLVQADYIFSANTVHIMSWSSVEAFFAGVGRSLAQKGLFCLYGPFNYAGQYTSTSNARFDSWLKERDPLSGIRNFEDFEGLAEDAELQFINDYPMPANNRILVWRKSGRYSAHL